MSNWFLIHVVVFLAYIQGVRGVIVAPAKGGVVYRLGIKNISISQISIKVDLNIPLPRSGSSLSTGVILVPGLFTGNGAPLPSVNLEISPVSNRFGLLGAGHGKLSVIGEPLGRRTISEHPRHS